MSDYSNFIEIQK